MAQGRRAAAVARPKVRPGLRGKGSAALRLIAARVNWSGFCVHTVHIVHIVHIGREVDRLGTSPKRLVASATGGQTPGELSDDLLSAIGISQVGKHSSDSSDSSDLSEVDWWFRPRGRPKGSLPTAGSEEPDPSAFCVLRFCVLCRFASTASFCVLAVLAVVERAAAELSKSVRDGNRCRRLRATGVRSCQRNRSAASAFRVRHPGVPPVRRPQDYCDIIYQALEF